jgi:hypothetical protein
MIKEDWIALVMKPLALKLETVTAIAALAFLISLLMLIASNIIGERILLEFLAIGLPCLLLIAQAVSLAGLVLFGRHERPDPRIFGYRLLNYGVQTLTLIIALLYLGAWSTSDSPVREIRITDLLALGYVVILAASIWVAIRYHRSTT